MLSERTLVAPDGVVAVLFALTLSMVLQLICPYRVFFVVQFFVRFCLF